MYSKQKSPQLIKYYFEIYCRYLGQIHPKTEVVHGVNISCAVVPHRENKLNKRNVFGGGGCLGTLREHGTSHVEEAEQRFGGGDITGGVVDLAE